jgi:hypothetical protein
VSAIAARRAKIRAPDVAACGFFREVVQGGGARLDLDMGRVFPAGLASQNVATRRNRRRASARRCDLAQVPRDAGAQKDRRVVEGLAITLTKCFWVELHCFGNVRLRNAREDRQDPRGAGAMWLTSDRHARGDKRRQ